MKNLSLSLIDFTGSEYIDKVCRSAEALGFGKYSELYSLAETPVDFFPQGYECRLDELLDKTGKPFSEPLAHSASGAATSSFAAALHRSSSPLATLGPFRVGEDGRLAIAGKSEHYQASLGHNFPGYALLQTASRLGISNLTHNNTRGHLTRLLERELIRVANGIRRGDESAVDAVLASTEPHVLNRVINLETGSLACESAVKMMLARFYRLQPHFEAPKYSGRTPVFLVMGDYQGGREANYHGTTVITQLFRGMWHELYEGMERAGLLKAVGVPINDYEGFRAIVEKYDCGQTKVAGFLHELVLMNYGAINLETEYVRKCHQLCQEHDIPCFVDEIQTCMWSPEILMFKEYGLHPDFVSVGKGFPGGLYPASKILTTAPMDNLNLFGALVTNGQEELASLANLITMRFAEENAAHTAAIGELWQQSLQRLAAGHKSIKSVEGHGLLTALCFEDAEHTVKFCHLLGDKYCIDISAQTYKANCPPAALSKLPLISSPRLIDFVTAAMDEALTSLEV